MSDAAVKEKYEGNFCGESVRFSREWGGHRFTDEECEKLCRGEEITITGLISKTGNPYGVTGKLEHQTYNGHMYVGFNRTGFVQVPHVPNSFCGHTFTDSEKFDLEAGKGVYCDDLVSSRTGKPYDATLYYGEKDDGSTGIIVKFDK